MLATLKQMEDQRDEGAFNDIWRVLGGEMTLQLETDEDWTTAFRLLSTLIQQTCGGSSDPYLAERKALGELAKILKVDTAEHPTIEGLEDALIEAAAAQINRKLASMSPDERRKFFEDAIKRMTDEDRIRLIDQFLEGYENLDSEEQKLFIKRLAVELGVSEDKLRAAIAGGAAALLPLVIADSSGFAVFLFTTDLMYTAFSTFGITVPFAAYVLKNEALGFLLGPVGMILTAGLSAGWFFHSKARKERRFRKLMQLIARAATWRDSRGLPPS
jgi:hypothetical protein